jgi:6-pyruvoyltetrahydropterin/6-carboxytetrahydropterin synthase
VPQFCLRKRFTFEAAHYLPQHEGKCRRLHGHSWVGWIEVTGNALHEGGSEDGMVMDFEVMSSCLKPLVEEYLDHHCLNETLQLKSPTSEAVAMFVYEHLAALQLPLASVTIEETCTSACTFRPGD